MYVCVYQLYPNHSKDVTYIHDLLIDPDGRSTRLHKNYLECEREGKDLNVIVTVGLEDSFSVK